MRRTGSFVFVFAAMAAIGLQGCDTAGSVEDPDLNYFIKYYGGDGDQSGVDMIALDDGTLLLLGNSAESAYTDIYLVRVNAEGDVLWERRLRGATATTILNAKDLERSGDGNFVVLADVKTDVGAQSDIKLFKISPDGAPLDSVAIGTVANDFSRSVTTLTDGGYMISGVTEFTSTWNLANEPDPDLGDTYDVRLNADLELLSANDWGPVVNGFGSNFDVTVKAFELSNTAGFYLFGYTNSTINGKNPNERLGLFYSLRGATGTVGGDVGIQGGVFYPGNVNDKDTEINFADRVPAEMGGGFVIVGTATDNLARSEIFLARMRASLAFTNNDAPLYTLIPFQRNVRGVAAASSLTGQFGYLILGNEVRSTGALNIFLAKVDQSGGVLWSTTFGSETQSDVGAAVTQMPDGKVYVLGTMGLADNQQKMVLIKINSEGLFLK